MKTQILILTFACINVHASAAAPDPFAIVETAGGERLEADEKRQFPIEKENRTESGVRIQVEEVSGEKVTLLLLNDSKKAIYIAGSGLGAPFFDPQIFEKGRWRGDSGHMNCGTGAYLSCLAAGKYFRFEATIPKGARDFRVGVSFNGEKNESGERLSTEIWTDTIHPKG